MAQERLLLIGDLDRQLYGALAQAAPSATIRSVATIFDGLSELAYERFTTIFAAAEPIERRPEAAVRTLRDLAGEAKLLLFGHPTLEPLSQKMLEFGADDYLISPAAPAELQRILSAPRAATAAAPGDETDAAPPPLVDDAVFSALPLAEIITDALVQNPQDALSQAIREINLKLAPGFSVGYLPEGTTPEGNAPALLEPVTEGGSVRLLHPPDIDATAPAAPAAFLARVAGLVSKLIALQERHNGLQRLAITDDLTGLFNGRYFRHFLTKITDKAREMRFPVTLVLFDIDNFKKYNDQFGHGVGDDILRQTAALMRRCCRDHDLVARISGDEFAVVFWEKEGPRKPFDPAAGPTGRTPHEPQQILARFRRLVESHDFPTLGPTGKGCLTISGGLAVYPYDARDVEGLIDAADKALMFGAKRSGRNSIRLVGDAEPRPERPSSPDDQ